MEERNNETLRKLAECLVDMSNKARNANNYFEKFCKEYTEDRESANNHEYIWARVTKMKGSKIEGGYIYDVNADGSVTPWGNPPPSVNAALSEGYEVFEVKWRGRRFKLISTDETVF